MTFINKAEVNPSPVQIRVTGTVPSPTWGRLQSLAYEPNSNAMAVSNAAPISTDQWTGGCDTTQVSNYSYGQLVLMDRLPTLWLIRG